MEWRYRGRQQLFKIEICAKRKDVMAELTGIVIRKRLSTLWCGATAQKSISPSYPCALEILTPSLPASISFTVFSSLLIYPACRAKSVEELHAAYIKNVTLNNYLANKSNRHGEVHSL